MYVVTVVTMVVHYTKSQKKLSLNAQDAGITPYGYYKYRRSKQMVALLSHRMFNHKRYHLIMKTGNKAIAIGEAWKWNKRGRLARVIKIDSGKRHGVYITE